MLSWIAKTAGGDLTSVTRHTARREAWNVESRNPEGGTEKYFLRIDRMLSQGKVSRRNLRREFRLIEQLNRSGIPAQKIIGWNGEYCAVLQSFESGMAELNREDRSVQDEVMRHFMEILAKLHSIDITQLKIPEFEHPRTPLEHALLEIEAVEEPDLFPVSICKTDVLSAFGKRWLINHAPANVQGTVLLQGDTGPANFLYDPVTAKVTTVVDWEWAHYGDPLEDLGNVWMRDFFYPSSGGDLTPYFRYYSDLTGFELNRKSIEYYKIHLLVRSVIALAQLAKTLDWQTPVSLNLGYRAFVDMNACQAMSEYAGVAASTESEPRHHFTIQENSLQCVIARQMEELVVPHIEDAFARSLVAGHASIARCLDLRPDMVMKSKLQKEQV